jgi:hypothetical protein
MSGISKIRGVIAVAACLVSTSCVRLGGSASGDLAPRATITFHNQGRERVQVYLVGEKEDWFIGRLEPLETARLALPQFGFTSASRSVALAVLPGWSKNLEPRRDPRATFSIDEVTDGLAGEEWFFVSGQLEGPVRRRDR